MEQRTLGTSGFKVPALGFGTGTFGGNGPLFAAWGSTDAAQARRLVDVCLDAGVTLFDTADVYSDGAAETILGEALKGRRDLAIVSTKVGVRAGPNANDVGASRYHVVRAVERSLQRLHTDCVDVLHIHQFDAQTNVESLMRTLDDLVTSGKVRYVGVSNYSGWQLMKSMAVAERYGYQRVAAHQVYYSLIGRDYEWELMPLALDQGIGAIVWSPLGWGRLTGRARRSTPPQPSRLTTTEQFAPPVQREKLNRVIEALDDVALETGRSIPQIAINWLLTRPTVATVLNGARNETQLRDNLGSIGWTLSAEHLAKLDLASAVTPPYPYYPYWNGQFAERSAPPVATREGARAAAPPKHVSSS